MTLNAFSADAPAPVPAGQAAPRDVNTHHLFTPWTDKAAWEARKAHLRQQILFSAGLYPMPEKTPLNPRNTGHIDGPGFTIENVAIETMPGFYLCGNLYRPTGKGPHPAIANPHGHWKEGRLQIDPDVPRAEPPPAKPGEGKANLAAIGTNLARQGFVVFAYDMVGYNDTDQVPHKPFSYTPQLWLWNVSPMGLQLWNSIRVVDFLSELPDVDPKRIGVTGASGGGTQTFLLCAVDERIQAAVPVNMVSAYMQGGCLCESGPGLRVGTDNVEVAAILAPKPLFMVAATGDWTKHNPDEEWPAIAKIYDLYGARDHTGGRQFNYNHNYNIESREAMYAWFGRWLLDDTNAEHFKEQPYTPDVKAMHVWNEKTPRPENALKEAELAKMLIANSEKQLAAIWPKDRESFLRFQKSMAPALANALSLDLDEHRALPEKLDPEVKTEIVTVIAAESAESLKAISDTAGKLGGTISGIVLKKNTLPTQAWLDFPTCYNRTPLGENVQALMDRLEAVKRQPGVKQIRLVGSSSAGLPALFACALFSGIERTVVDVNRFNSNDDQAYIDGLYASGLRRAGDVRTAVLLAATNSLFLHNTGNAFQTDAVSAACNASGVKIGVEKEVLSNDKIAEFLSGK